MRGLFKGSRLFFRIALYGVAILFVAACSLGLLNALVIEPHLRRTTGDSAAAFA